MSFDSVKRNQAPYVSWLFAAIGLAFALSYYYFAVIDIDFFNSRLPSLGPGPDGQGYFAGAINYIREGEIKIRIGDDLLPSRYPPGFSAVIIPFTYLLDGDEIVLAPYMANRTIGLLILLSTFGFFIYLKRYYAAGISAAILATLPSFVIYSRSSLSENLGALLILWSYLLTYIALKKNNNKILALAGFALGLALSTRVALVLFGTVLAAVFLINRDKGLPRNLRTAAVVGLCFLAGTIPFFYQNWSNFGDPLTTGYSYWMPSLFNSFSFSSFENGLEALWQEITLTRTVYSEADIFGTGTNFTPLYFLIVLIALLHMLVRPNLEKMLFSVSVLITVVILGSYDWIHLRKYYPHQVLSVCLVANFYHVIIDTAAKTWRRVRLRTIGVTIFCIATIGLLIAGYPSRSGWKVGELKMQFVELLNPNYLGRMDNRYEPIRRLPSYLETSEALVLVQTRNINVVLASSLLAPTLTIIPEDGGHRYYTSPHWKMRNEEIDAYMLESYADNLPIYYLGANNEATDSLERLSGLIAGARWQTLEHDKLVYLACLKTKQNRCPAIKKSPSE